MRILNLLLISGIFVIASTASAATLRGRVRNVGASDPNHDGIEGTIVTVYDADQKIVGKPVSTDTNGEYSVVNLPSVSTAKVVFDKNGFRRHPHEETNIAIDRETIMDVDMIEQAGTQAYYEKVVDRIRNTDPASRDRYLSLVRTLDYQQRRTVDSLRSGLSQIKGLSLMDGYGLPGVTVSLSDCSACPSTCGCTSTPVQTVVTGVDGMYKFADVPKGEYVVRAELFGAGDSLAEIRISETASSMIDRDLPMRLSTVTEAITVTASTPILDVVGADPNQPVVLVPGNCAVPCEIPTTVAVADATGRLNRQLPEGHYQVIVPNVGGAPTVCSVNISAQTTTMIDVSPPQ